MTLIEFLISENKKGWEWPDSIVKATSTKGGRGVNFYFDYACPPSLSNTLIAPTPFSSSELVTRDKYEAALAASKPEWDGEGLPPVGCRVEVKADDFEGDWLIIDVAYVHNGEVIGIVQSENEYLNDRLEKFSAGYNRAEFRPIRSEADKKKEAAVFAIAELCRGSASNGHSAELIYDAIKSGKIVID